MCVEFKHSQRAGGERRVLTKRGHSSETQTLHIPQEGQEERGVVVDSWRHFDLFDATKLVFNASLVIKWLNPIMMILRSKLDLNMSAKN